MFQQNQLTQLIPMYQLSPVILQIPMFRSLHLKNLKLKSILQLKNQFSHLMVLKRMGMIMVMRIQVLEMVDIMVTQMMVL
ncbi:MAG: hypothetical protein H6605_11240 [Flavobacteriales bacterium]|nr:hypothetical protein [Flavobacteriales bacterium]